MLWTRFKEWLPFFIPALSNFVLVLAGIWMSLPDFATSVEKNRMAKRGFGALCLVFGHRRIDIRSNRTAPRRTIESRAFQEVKSGLDKTDVELRKTDTLLDKMSTVETGVSLVDANINKLNGQLSVAIKHVTRFGKPN